MQIVHGKLSQSFGMTGNQNSFTRIVIQPICIEILIKQHNIILCREDTTAKIVFKRSNVIPC